VQAAKVSRELVSQFNVSIEYAIGRTEVNDAVGALIAFSEARQIARTARELCPVGQYPSWTSRQNLATGYINATTRRVAPLGAS
jgi:hypothetical protein